MSSSTSCYYCFKALDSNDPNPKYQTFVQCTSCETVHHSRCWEENEGCSRCGATTNRPYRARFSKQKASSNSREAVAIIPATIVDETGRKIDVRDSYAINSSRAIFFTAFRTVWAIFVGGMLAGLASWVSAFTYRILSLDTISSITILDIFFRALPPQPAIFVGILMAGVVSAVIMFSRPRSFFWKLIHLTAGFVTVVATDITLFQVTLADIAIVVGESRIPISLAETLYGQVTVFIITVILVPLFRSLSKGPYFSIDRHLESLTLKNIYGLLRLLFSSSIVVTLVALFVVYVFIPTSSRVLMLDLPIHLPLTTTVSVNFLSALIVNIGLASVLFWLPSYRYITWKLGIGRLIILVACLFGFGIVYRQSIDPNMLLQIVSVSGASMILCIPIQLSLS